jgi:hypothetical protein
MSRENKALKGHLSNINIIVKRLKDYALSGLDE